MEASPAPIIDVAHLNRTSGLDIDTSTPQIPLVRRQLSLEGHLQLNVEPRHSCLNFPWNCYQISRHTSVSENAPP